MKSHIKVAMVVQRYGVEINGGSEAYCRQVAERLNKYFDVEILTTCASDYMSWKNQYGIGEELINGVKVIRFKVDCERNVEEFNKASAKLVSNKGSFLEQIQWNYKQGPQCQELLDYIRDNEKTYDVFIFMTYLYFTTFFGMQMVPQKSILIPTAHDEPWIYLDIYRAFFHLPRFVAYNTVEEQKLVNKLFENSYIPSDIFGVGLDVPDCNFSSNFKDKCKIEGNYIVYVGRIDESKGCKVLFEYFLQYKKETNSDIKLVLIGKSVMEAPKHKDIVELGFLSEEDKFLGIYYSKLLVMPSQYESLSMVVLESMKMQKPVLVNGKCEVLRGHCQRSNAGLYYNNYHEFVECLEILLHDDKVSTKMGLNGKEYVEKNYNWDRIEAKFCKVIEDFTAKQ